jgi:hypothetical protein
VSVSIRVAEYESKTGLLRISQPKRGGSPAVQLTRTAQRLVNPYLDLHAARAITRRYDLLADDPLFASIYDAPLSY